MIQLAYLKNGDEDVLIIWILAVASFLCLAVLLIAYVCYRMAFFAPRHKHTPGDGIDIPEGEIYEPFRKPMEQWAREVRAMPHEAFSITSFDGLTLWGKYYEYAPGSPIELMFHGYRGTAGQISFSAVSRWAEAR